MAEKSRLSKLQNRSYARRISKASSFIIFRLDLNIHFLHQRHPAYPIPFFTEVPLACLCLESICYSILVETKANSSLYLDR